MAEVGADGINGDTQDGVPLAFSLAADKAGHSLAFEPEGGPADEALAWNVMTWGQYRFPFAPLVDKYKWLETRHMVNISDRWNRDKTDDLQFAFFNGVGWESWENIWGIWNGITPRDAEATRRVAAIERAIAPFLISPGWEPMSPMLRYGVFASRWPLNGQTVWTIVNRNEYDVDGQQMEIAAEFGRSLFRSLPRSGTQTSEQAGWKDGAGVLDRSQRVWRHSGNQHCTGPEDALLDVENETTDGYAVGRLFARMESLPPADRANPATKAANSAPAGMVKIPEGDFLFKVSGIEIEGLQ